MKFSILIAVFLTATVNAGQIDIRYNLGGSPNHTTYRNFDCLLNDYDTPDIIFKSGFETDEYRPNVQDAYYFNLSCVNWNLSSKFGDVSNSYTLVGNTPYLCIAETFDYVNDAAFYIELNCTSIYNP